jgi:hypothetical protein
LDKPAGRIETARTAGEKRKDIGSGVASAQMRIALKTALETIEGVQTVDVNKTSGTIEIG